MYVPRYTYTCAYVYTFTHICACVFVYSHPGVDGIQYDLWKNLNMFRIPHVLSTRTWLYICIYIGAYVPSGFRHMIETNTTPSHTPPPKLRLKSAPDSPSLSLIWSSFEAGGVWLGVVFSIYEHINSKPSLY